MLEEWRVEEHAAVDAEYERRKAEISDARTRLRVFVLDREKLAVKQRADVFAHTAMLRARKAAKAGTGVREDERIKK
jgi:hypothetical protein